MTTMNPPTTPPSAAGFTPGPWRMHDMEEGVIVGADRLAVALVGGYSRSRAEDAANRRLIAAAPELLEELNRTADMLASLIETIGKHLEHDCSYSRQCVDQARAAIASATANQF